MNFSDQSHETILLKAVHKDHGQLVMLYRLVSKFLKGLNG